MKPKITAAEECSNKIMQAMLVPYAEGSLAKADKAGMEAHLSECSACRGDLRHIKEVLRPLSELSHSGFHPVFDAHPPHEQMFAYAMKSEAQSEEQKRTIRLHTIMCAECRRELELIEGVDREFSAKSAAASAGWVLPPVLRRLFRSSEHTDTSELRKFNINEIPWKERLEALVQKVNLRLAVVVGAALFVIFLGLCFITCGSDEETAAASNPAAGSGLARAETAAGEQVKLSFEDGTDPIKACEALDKEKIPYSKVSGGVAVDSKDLDKAKAAIAAAGSDSASETSAESSEYAAESSEGQNSEQQAADSYAAAPEGDSAPSENAAASESESVSESADSYAEAAPEQEAQAEAPARESAPEPSYASAPEPAPEPKARAVPAYSAPAFSQPRIAVPKRSQSGTVYSVKPSSNAKVHSRPIRTYTSSGYSAAPAPISIGRVETAASQRAREAASPSPAIIRPASDASVQAVRTPEKTESESSEAQAEAASPVSSPAHEGGSEFVTGGDTYNDSDSVTSRESIQ